MKQQFEMWFNNLRESISTFEYYVDFEKVERNVESIKLELHLMNSLLGVEDIEHKFEMLVKKYPEVIQVIPILLAVRNTKIYCQDELKEKWYSFKKDSPDTLEELCYFMKKTGLFDLLSNGDITNLVDYVTGIEVGLDSNTRKNRGGHLMEDKVEFFIQQAGFVKDVTYFKEMRTTTMTEKFGLNLDEITHSGKAVKKFDFVLKTNNVIYGVETNFYATQGSKLNETARSYKKFALESKNMNGFKFLWITDGIGWKFAKQYLEETYEVLEHVYNLKNLEEGILEKIKNEEN